MCSSITSTTVQIEYDYSSTHNNAGFIYVLHYVNTHLYREAWCGPVSTHVPFGVIADPVAAFLFLMYDL